MISVFLAQQPGVSSHLVFDRVWRRLLINSGTSTPTSSMKVPGVFVLVCLHIVKASFSSCESVRLSESQARLVCKYPMDLNQTKQDIGLILYSKDKNGTVILCHWDDATLQCVSDDGFLADVQNVHNEFKVDVTALRENFTFACETIPGNTDISVKRCTMPSAEYFTATVSGSSVNTTKSVQASEDSCTAESFGLPTIITLTLVIFAMGLALLLTCIRNKRLQRRLIWHINNKDVEGQDEEESF